MKSNNPHDAAVKDIFSDPRRIREIMQLTLPPVISDYLDYSKLKRENASFVDEELKEHHSDMLFSIQTKEQSKIKIYFLMEHKSYVDKNINRQLLGYLCQIYRNMKELQVVIPLVFYHGEKEWRVSKNFYDLFRLSDYEKELFRDYIPSFAYEVMDLSVTEINSLITSLTMKAILYSFKNIWGMEDTSRLDDFFRLSRDLFFERDGLRIIEKLILYIYSAKEIEPEILKRRIELLISENKGGLAMTTAELLIEKGIEKGKLETAENLLANGISLDVVLKSTGLTEEQLQNAGIIDSTGIDCRK